MNIFYVIEDDGTHIEIKESEWRKYYGDVRVKYRCYHCGDIKNSGGVVVHKDSCKIGADERLNHALFMVDFLKSHIFANDIATDRVVSCILEFEEQYK